MKWFTKILTLLGVGVVCTACYAPGNTEYNRVKNGFIMGKVTDGDGKPVNNIKVSVGSNDMGYTYTGTDGYYRVYYRVDYEATSVLLEFDDIDGAENGGEFASTNMVLSLDNDTASDVVMTLKE